MSGVKIGENAVLERVFKTDVAVMSLKEKKKHIKVASILSSECIPADVEVILVGGKRPYVPISWVVEALKKAGVDPSMIELPEGMV